MDWAHNQTLDGHQIMWRINGQFNQHTSNNPRLAHSKRPERRYTVQCLSACTTGQTVIESCPQQFANRPGANTWPLQVLRVTYLVVNSPIG